MPEYSIQLLCFEFKCRFPSGALVRYPSVSLSLHLPKYLTWTSFLNSNTITNAIFEVHHRQRRKPIESKECGGQRQMADALFQCSMKYRVASWVLYNYLVLVSCLSKGKIVGGEEFFQTLAYLCQHDIPTASSLVYGYNGPKYGRKR